MNKCFHLNPEKKKKIGQLCLVVFEKNVTNAQVYSVFAFALCINNISLFYLDHSFANAAKPRLRSRSRSV